MWVIRNDERLYWSNDDGWGDRESASQFSDQERLWFRLPIGAGEGAWVDENQLADDEDYEDGMRDVLNEAND